MKTKNPLSVNTQIGIIAECIKDLSKVIPMLKKQSNPAYVKDEANSQRWKSPLIQDINRQEIVKSIIYCLRDLQYELLHKPIAKRKYVSACKKLTLDQSLSLLNIYEQDKLEEPLLKKTDPEEIKLTFERCHIQLSNVKSYTDFRAKLHTTLQSISQYSTPAPVPTPASTPIYNIEEDELF